jgi:hypothetical protein
LLLLPVHVQTRFVDGGDGSSELWVRIFPDQIAVDAHEPELTAQEIADGEAYWTAVWQAGNPPLTLDVAQAPWRALASRYTPQRAAWIALQLTPTNQGQQPAAPSTSAPVPAPVFPTVPTRATSWEKPAVADALPDAWTVVLVSGGQTTVHRSSPIITPLPVSLTPNGAGFPAGSAVDAGLQWMVEFPTAVAAGMGLTIPLTKAQRAAGFDQIFVYGLRASDASPEQTWTNLLVAHHYTDGLAFLPQGAPTNNTTDAPSAYSRKDPNYAVSFATERQAPLTANLASDAQVFAALTGTPLGTFDHIQYADGTGAQNATDMLRVLWPATMGYFLQQMLADVFTLDQIDAGRQYALASVFPRGPLPALRTGTVPYGVLPVTTLAGYRQNQDAAGVVEPHLATLLDKLRPIWLASSIAAPHMQRGGDPDHNLLSVLGMDASSMSFQGRAVLGNTFLWNYLNFLGVPAQFHGQWWQDLALPVRTLLSALGYPSWNPRLLEFGFAETSSPVNFSTVQDAPLSETTPLAADASVGEGKTANYISWLQTAAIADIQSENYPGLKPTSLLYKILRQSALLEYAVLAGGSEVQAGRLSSAQLHEGELIAMQAAPTTLTPWQVLARPAVPNPQLTWAEYLVAPSFAPGSPYAELNDFRASLARLAELPTAELDRLLTETLDACSHRLDAWVTGVATALLQRTRNRNNTAIGLGCYGWVEDVRPETGRVPVVGDELAAVGTLDAHRAKMTNGAATRPLPVPLQPLSDNGGYIYAPSQTQAAVGAVLRSGYLTHQETAEGELLAIDLSSERVNRALGLIRGVQQGQSLNALLGYLFEDALSAQGLQQYIQPFRNAYPVVGSKLTPSSAPSESVAASNVIDGLALRTAWDGGQLSAGGIWGAGLPGPGADQNAVLAILQTLDDDADALGDLSMAEAVFQVVRGNFGRGGGLMDAISRGERPPDPDVVATPSGGIDLTHRVALLFAGAPAKSAAWSSVPTHARASAEPWLDAWIGHLLPDPATVRCQVRYRDTGGSPHTTMVSLADLQIGPLDLLAMSDAAQTPQRSEIDRRILYAAALPAGAEQVQIVFDTSGLPAGSIAFPDALYLAQTLRTLVGAARPLTPQDFTTPETDAASAGGAVQLAELRTRVQGAVTSLTSDLATLQAASTPDAVRAALLACSYYGVAGSIPLSATGSDPLLSQQQISVAAALTTRLQTATKVSITTAAVGELVGALQTIFGSDFVALPQCTPPSLSALHTAFSKSSSLIATDPQAPARWLRQVTYTHAGVSRLDLALSAAQALGGSAGESIYPPALTLAQMPSPDPTAPPDRWLALPLDPAHPSLKGRIALDCVATGDPTTTTTYAGLLVEEWLERIPGTQASTAVAFHFEEPSARAPNVILLAVCPREQGRWDDATLQAILAETLELAKIRTVDLASVGTVGQILPALYFALNLQGATISTQFAEVKEVPIEP